MRICRDPRATQRQGEANGRRTDMLDMQVIMPPNPPVREVCSVGLRSGAKPYGGVRAGGDGITDGRSEA